MLRVLWEAGGAVSDDPSPFERRPLAPSAPPYGGDILGDYLADNYGQCRLTPCRCLRAAHGWIGRACVHWVPTTARTWDELKALQRAVYEAAP